MNRVHAVLIKSLVFLALPAAMVFVAVSTMNQPSKVVEGKQVDAQELAAGNLMGARYRVAWVRDMQKGGRDPHAYGANFHLMGYDSREGRERTILGKIGSYRKPLITSDGERIVFSDFPGKKVEVVNWDGSGRRVVVPGLALDVWKDPAGAEWVYYVSGMGTRAILEGGTPVMRCRLDGPAAGQGELVWGLGEVSLDTFQVSKDGKMAACLYPWPKAGRLDLSPADPKDRRVSRLQNGCWVAMAPDNSYTAWVFDGPHRHLYLSRHGTDLVTKVRIADAPGIRGAEVYHPKWSNHVRFFAMSGPYKNQEKGSVNAIGGGGPFDIYVGRFDPAFQAVDAWTRITEDEHPNQFPDLWIEGGEKEGVDVAPVGPTVAVGDSWPSQHAGLHWVWENKLGANEIDPPEESGESFRTSDARLVGRALYGAHGFGIFNTGGLRARKVDTSWAKAVNASKAFTIEVAFFAGSGVPRPAWSPLAMYGESRENCNVAIAHMKRGNLLVVRLNGRDYSFGKMQMDKPTHFVVTYRDGKLAAFSGGYGLGEHEVGPLMEWKPGPLTFATSADGTLNFDGYLENLAVYHRNMGGAEAGLHSDRYQQSILETKQPPVAVVQGVLKEVTPSAAPADIAPYRRYLVEYAYDVKKVIEGDPALAGKTIRVLHWSVLDAKPLALDFKVGNTYEMVIGPKGSRKELAGERSNEGSLSATSLPGYLDLAQPAPFAK